MHKNIPAFFFILFLFIVFSCNNKKTGGGEITAAEEDSARYQPKEYVHGSFFQVRFFNLVEMTVSI
jgi:hypothetical protein